MYSSKPSIVIGFHGCGEKRRNELLNSSDGFYRSEKKYDWLGNGMYFWEGNDVRALEWAIDKLRNETNDTPAVIGAVIDLGICLDLVDSRYLKLLKSSYLMLEDNYKAKNEKLPENKSRKLGDTTRLKALDCAVIESIHANNKNNGFDSTRGVFWEGDPLYANTDHREKNHIQICVRNPNCIKGFFIPRVLDLKWKRPGSSRQ